MQNDVMMALGGFRFSVGTAAYQMLERNTEYRWNAIERQGRATAMQFAGPGADEFTLSGVIYPHYFGGLGQIDAMRRLAGLGKALLLVDGQGVVHGDFVITRINEKQPKHDENGIPKKQEFELSLVYYGEDNAL